MELWLLLALSAPFVYAIAHIIDKIIISKYVETIAPIFAVIGLFDVVLMIVLYSLGARFEYSIYGFIAFTAGFVLILGGYFHYSALQREEASRVMPLLFTTPLFVLILATIFLDEVFTLGQYLGIGLIIIGSVLISIRKLDGVFRRIKGLRFIVGSVALWSIWSIILKWVFNYIEFSTLFLHGAFGFFSGSLFFWVYPKTRREILPVIRTRVAWIIVANGLIVLVADLLYLYAVLLGPISLIVAIQSIEGLYILIIATILSVFKPHLMAEDTQRGVLTVKLVAVALIISGVYLIS